MTMSISGVNQPEPSFGIGPEELESRWIDRDTALRAAGMLSAAEQLRMLRREMQEALYLVADPAAPLQRKPDLKALRHGHILRRQPLATIGAEYSLDGTRWLPVTAAYKIGGSTFNALGETWIRLQWRANLGTEAPDEQ
jgi:hypothetical protein